MQSSVNVPVTSVSVFDETEVLVVGAGPAGIAAALSAARMGAKVILIDSTGKLGGLATGGIVMMLPNIDNGTSLKCLGIQKEWVERLRAVPDAIYGPDAMDIGSNDPKLISQWNPTLCNVWNGKIVDSVFFDPEYLSLIFCQMIEEENNITTYLHMWASEAYIEDGELKGVIFESKEGRKAILAQRIVDCTGDGDVYASAGADFEYSYDAQLRNSDISLVTRIEHVDYDEFARYKLANPEDYTKKSQRLQELVGYRLAVWSANRNDNAWINNAVRGKNALSVRDVTDLEFSFRTSYPKVQEFFRKEYPGFEHCSLMDFASLIGCRSSRRIKGLYQIKFSDFKKGIRYDDTIAATPAMHCSNFPDVGEVGMYIPYRTLIPEKLDNLIAAGRCISCDVESHNWLNLIPHSVATGEAAGAAAYISIQENIQPRAIDIKKLQKVLVEDKGCCIG